MSQYLSGVQWASTIPGVTVLTPVLVTTDVLGFLLVPILQFLEKTSLPTHLPFLPVYTRAVGEGHSSQEPCADAVQNIGFNELQNEEAAADTYGWRSHPPPCPACAV